MTLHYDPVRDFEDRRERHESPSTVCHPNGSHVCSTSARFLAVAAREVLDIHLGPVSEQEPAA